MDYEKRIMVFVKEGFVRDAQAFMESAVTDNYYDSEEGWRDISGPVLVADWSGEEMTLSKAKERIQNLYPESSSEIFSFIQIK